MPPSITRYWLIMGDGADDVVGRYEIEGAEEGINEGIDDGLYDVDGFAEGVDVHDELKGSQMGRQSS